MSARIQKSEVFAIGFSLFILTWFLLQSNRFVTYYDLQNFLNAGRGDFSHYYYAYWVVPAFSLLAKLHHPYPFLIIGIADIICTLFAVRIFGGRIVPLLASIYMIYILSQGQITGIILGGFALFVTGLINRRWHMAGLGILIATIKYQMGVIPVLSLLVLWNYRWKDKIKILLVPAFVTMISFVMYPNWPLQLIQSIQFAPPGREGSISLWEWVGPFALILWFPPLWFNLSENKKFVLLLTANALSLPYFQQTDLMILFSLFSGYGAAFSNIPFLLPASIVSPPSPWALIRLLFLIPLGVYVAELGQFILENFRSRPTKGIFLGNSEDLKT